MATPSTTPPTVTLDELARHDGRDGRAWMAIAGEVYDVSAFAPKHPGGDLLSLGAGRDATILFEAYHPGPALDHARRALAKQAPRVGTVALAERAPAGDPAFFDAVRTRVDATLRARGLGYQSFGWALALEAVALLALFVAAWAWRITTGSYLAAVLGGLVVARLGFAMHSGNHAAVGRRGRRSNAMGSIMDVVGGSSLVWRYAHQVAHHGRPNVVGYDNDAEIGYPLLRFHPALPRRPWHRVQVVTLAVGMSIGLVKWLVADLQHLWRGQAIHTRFHVSRRAWAKALAGKALWCGMHVVAPVVLLGPLHGLATTLVMMAVGAYYMESVFIVNHLQAGLVPDPAAHWAVQQVQGTANWRTHSRLANWWSGGLNHQIEHHLFPSMSIYLYPVIAPVVQATCAEFGLRYRDLGSFPRALASCLGYLHDLGRPAPASSVEAEHPLPTAPVIG
ncbi:MAG: fatty acid desaturase [Kofleriaceae bacterium]